MKVKRVLLIIDCIKTTGVKRNRPDKLGHLVMLLISLESSGKPRPFETDKSSVQLTMLTGHLPVCRPSSSFTPGSASPHNVHVRNVILSHS